MTWILSSQSFTNGSGRLTKDETYQPGGEWRIASRTTHACLWMHHLINRYYFIFIWFSTVKFCYRIVIRYPVVRFSVTVSEISAVGLHTWIGLPTKSIALVFFWDIHQVFKHAILNLLDLQSKLYSFIVLWLYEFSLLMVLTKVEFKRRTRLYQYVLLSR